MDLDTPYFSKALAEAIVEARSCVVVLVLFISTNLFSSKDLATCAEDTAMTTW